MLCFLTEYIFAWIESSCLFVALIMEHYVQSYYIFIFDKVYFNLEFINIYWFVNYFIIFNDYIYV